MVTVPVTANVLLRGQLSYLRERGFDITVLSSPGPELDELVARESVAVIGVPMAREIDPTMDPRSLYRLTIELRRLAPDIVNAGTAKGGLLGMVAAASARVPVRIYQLRGLRLETERGVKRRVLAATERLAAACAHRVICNSNSLRESYVAAGFASAAKCTVVGDGSSNGVDVVRFSRARWEGSSKKIREDLAIPAEAPVIGFVGRPVGDKGIGELLDAFAVVRARVPAARLVLVGEGFAGDAPPQAIRALLRQPNVHLVGRVAEPAPYYAAFDVFAFPSHREGFPNAPLEAAAMGLATVGARSTGVRDAIVDGETGTLVDVGDVSTLAAALTRYLLEPSLRDLHGRAARRRAESRYAQQVVWANWLSEYDRLLVQRGLSRPQRGA